MVDITFNMQIRVNLNVIMFGCLFFKQKIPQVLNELFCTVLFSDLLCKNPIQLTTN